jgi:hypothetical protein
MAGDRLQRKWRDLFNMEPPKVPRKKKRGGGKHMFAAYPPHFFPLMDQIIHEVREELRHLPKQHCLEWSDEEIEGEEVAQEA